MNYYLKCLSNYAKFSGRARRKEYWTFFFVNMIISFVFGFISGFIGIPELSLLYTLALIIPSLAVGVRRMHDVGKSGWFLLIPIYNFILLLSTGQEGNNKYGSDPKDDMSQDLVNAH